MIASRHLTDRFRFSSPSREPSGEVIAGSPGLRPARRLVRIGMRRSGMGIECRPDDDSALGRRFRARALRPESRGLGDQRRRMLAGLAGHVVEIGAGNGLNFAHYPDSVTMVHAFEPDPYLRALAIRAAENAAVSVSVGEAIAEGLPLKDGSVDAAVASLVLCSVKDVVRAVAELHRVVPTRRRTSIQ